MVFELPTGAADNSAYRFDSPVNVLQSWFVDDLGDKVGDALATCVRDSASKVTCTLNTTNGALTPGQIWSVQIGIDQVVAGTKTIAPLITVSNASGESYQAASTLTDSCSQTTPVLLSYFSSSRGGDAVHFEWTTSTETANAGFNLYVDAPGGLAPIGDFIPSAVIDSMEPQDYSLDAPAGAVSANAVYVQEVAINGVTRLHGPYEVDVTYGARTQPTPIDWDAIAAEDDLLKQQPQCIQSPPAQLRS